MKKKLLYNFINNKKFTSIGLSWKECLLFKNMNKLFYIFFYKNLIFFIPTNNLNKIFKKCEYFDVSFRFLLFLQNDLFIFSRVRFKGKGYKIFLKKNRIDFFFIFGHRTKVILKNIFFKYFKKRGFNIYPKTIHKNFLMLLLRVLQLRKLNIFTSSGVKILNSLFHYKQGKISTYM